MELVAHIAREEKRYKVKLMLILAHQKQKDTQTSVLFAFQSPQSTHHNPFATFYHPKITIIQNAIEKIP